MWKFVAHRTAHLVLVLLVATFIAHLAVQKLVDPFKTLGEKPLPPATQKLLREQFGLDEPLFTQYVVYLKNLATGQLGVDYKQRRPVIDLLADVAPATFRLAVFAVAIQVVLGIVIGVLAAVWHRSAVDMLINVSTIALMSVPLFVLAVFLRDTLSGVPVFGWEPFPLIPRSIGVEITWLQELLLPAVTLGVGSIAFTVRLTRGSMLEVLGADYVRTARAKGMSERRVLFKHALRNAVLPVANFSAIQLGALLSGTVVVETIFQYPGLGHLFVRSLRENNNPVMIAILVYSVLLFIIVIAVVDILSAYLDPRIRTP